MSAPPASRDNSAWFSFASMVSSAVRRPAAASGILLLCATVTAIVWANSPWAASYHALWSTTLGVGVGNFGLVKPLVLWVNDLLMAVFFLLVGLEIKRELIAGSLSSLKSAVLPIAGAVGGVLIPAMIYLGVNRLGNGVPDGWAIPAATDIAFALGILALLGSRVPVTLKVFLTTVAVFDDLMAVGIIALFFTAELSWTALAASAGALLVLAILNLSGVRRSLPYIVVGLVLWLAVLKSGLHATLAGVLLAMAVPLRGAVAPETFLARLTGLVGTSDRESAGGLAPDSLLHRARAACDDAEAPLVRWEHAIQPTVLFFIVPVFALANAGVALGSQVVENGWAGSTGAVTRGVALGLFVGKPLGVTAFAWLAVRLGVAELPEQLDWRKLHASSWLAGIGFTMSLFISGLALTGPALEAAKQGLLIGSGLAAVLGTALVWKACAPNASRGLVSTPPTQTEGGVRSF